MAVIPSATTRTSIDFVNICFPLPGTGGEPGIFPKPDIICRTFDKWNLLEPRFKPLSRRHRNLTILSMDFLGIVISPHPCRTSSVDCSPAICGTMVIMSFVFIRNHHTDLQKRASVIKSSSVKSFHPRPECESTHSTRTSGMKGFLGVMWRGSGDSIL